MNLIRLQKQHDVFVAVLFHKGFLDDQFKELHQLQDESNPHFVEELLTMFFNDSEKLVDNIARALEKRPVDFNLIYNYFHRLKGSSASVGAGRVKDVCVNIKYPCDAQNLEGCMRCLQELHSEISVLKSNLQNLFMQQREIVAVGGSIPKIQ